MINKIGKITVYVQDQEQAKDFWLNKIGFVLKFEKPIGPNMSWIEVGPSEARIYHISSLFLVGYGTT